MTETSARPRLFCATMLLVAAYVVGLLAAMLLWPALPQDPAYHAFASRTSPGIDLANVLTNVTYLLAGSLGWIVIGRGALFESGFERLLARIFFAALFATGLGSAWYHHAPDNLSLFWDRLPLSVVLVSVTALMIAERTHVDRAGSALVVVWLFVGPLAVIYWHLTETFATGDLRPYLALHAMLIVVPPLAFLLPARYTHTKGYLIALTLYLFGYLGDRLDHQIYALTGEFVSGHNIKHVATGAAAAMVAWTMSKRQPIQSSAAVSGR
ncbi:hypothetical protein [Azoarcus taiwanensis]|uniref:Alkaline phytoceramidase n=1 Tax=Azoarcus taiwanensis TaxID=666964 RepID=A0A972JCL1_9RHOO|nr:hypothetical protein [Azoarcus taiwanensis]NMG04627.1 hypothetical protein [Azoarcus taiwanensis]